MQAVLTTNHLSKSYGKIRAVDDLSLEIASGSVYGILGPNGSGKTTTLGMILGVTNPDSGSFTWFGDTSVKDARRRIGSLLETPNFYPYLSASNNLQVVCKIKGIDASSIDSVLKRVNLFERRTSKYKTFSLGMKQRLGLASALLGNPEVLVLDEPTNGLDPQGIAEVRELIIKVADEGKTIIIASHNLDEVEKICSHVAILRSGKLLSDGQINMVLSKDDQVLVAANDMELLKVALNGQEKVKSCNRHEQYFAVTLAEDFGSEALNKYLFESGVVLSELSVKKKSLETQFLEIVKQ